jgi:branched-chain amino acid transport system permease protein
MEFLVEQLINGLTRGSEYALIAAGLTLIFGVVQIVNFAQGEFYAVGAYALFVLSNGLGLPYGWAAVATVVATAAFGALFYVGVVHRLIDRAWQMQLVATLAASILLINLLIVTAGSLPRRASSPLTDEIVSVAGVDLSLQRLLVFVVAGVSFGALAAFLHRAKLGKAMRAVAQNREACVVAGIPVARTALAAVIISGALAGAAAATIPPLYNVQPTMGAATIVMSFAAVIVGGLGNVPGAVVAAFGLGLAEALAVGYVSSEYAKAIAFAIMILVLLFRPLGLFGQAVRV